MCSALEKQKAGLEELAERRLEWSLRGKEREMQQELSYQVSGLYTCTMSFMYTVHYCVCVCRWIRCTGSFRVT